MSNAYSNKTSESVRSVLQSVMHAAGVTTLDLSNSPSFKLVLESRDGQSLSYSLTPYGAGQSMSGLVRGAYLAVPGSGGAADLDGAYGTGVMVGNTLDITVPATPEGLDPVPADAIIYAVKTTAGGKPKSLNAVRLSATQIRVYSDGTGYSGPNEVDTVPATLVAGTRDITTNVAPATTDLLFVEQVTAGGGAAQHYAAFRKDATDITIQAYSAAGALVATNTATVRAHKFPVGAAAAATATGTLVAGVATIALTNAAGDILLVKQETAGGTAANHFSVVRVDNNSVKVYAHTVAGALQALNTSAVRVYNMGAVKAAASTLVAGTMDILLTVAAADRLSVKEITAGGDPATSFVVFRKDADEVTVVALDATPAKVATNTSVVQVYNHGQSGAETSTIRWAVVRP